MDDVRKAIAQCITKPDPRKTSGDIANQIKALEAEVIELEALIRRNVELALLHVQISLLDLELTLRLAPHGRQKSLEKQSERPQEQIETLADLERALTSNLN